MKKENELLAAIAVATEATGTEMSKTAILFVEQELSLFPLNIALSALRRACRECGRGRFCLKEVLDRIDDGRPTADEAWALVPMDEDKTVVWNDEICEAWSTARGLIKEGDHIAARMAFKEAYKRVVTKAKEQGKAPHWWASLGHDPHGRAPAIQEAVELGRLPAPEYREYLPLPAPNTEGIKRLENLLKQIE